MSLILDALKRAEQERKLGQPPEAAQVASMTPPASAPAPRDRTLIIVLAVLLLAAAIVIGALLLRSHKPAAIVTVTRPPVTTAVPATAAAAVTAASPPSVSAVVDRNQVSSLDDVVAADDGNEENEQAARVAQGHLPGDAPETSPAPRKRATPARQRAAAPAPPPPPPPIDSDANVVTTPSPAAGVPTLRQMPDAYRSGFPQLSIQVHAYNDDPDRRFIIVGGTAYHEGGQLPQGPTIAAIAPDGIVFDWRGQRVFYSLNGN